VPGVLARRDRQPVLPSTLLDTGLEEAIGFNKADAHGLSSCSDQAPRQPQMVLPWLCIP
jgi:hypothetical protein